MKIVSRKDLSVMKMEFVNVEQSAVQTMTVRMVRHVKRMEHAPAQMIVVLMKTALLDLSVKMGTATVILNAALMQIASMARSVKMTEPVPAPPNAALLMTVRMATSAMNTVTASWRASVTRTGPVLWPMEPAALQRLVEATPPVSTVTLRTNSASPAVRRTITACQGLSALIIYARTEG